jgi:hypothetical protein
MIGSISKNLTMNNYHSSVTTVMSMTTLQKTSQATNNPQKLKPHPRKMAGNKFAKKTLMEKTMDLMKDFQIPNH